MSSLRIGISTCPNDTFAFHALMTGSVRIDGVDELDFTLLDVEELNEAMLRGDFDACKVSYHAALAMADRVLVLPSGSALGFGVGPLLLGAAGRTEPSSHASPPLVLSPGRWTTAHLLWKLFHPEPVTLEHVVFSDIMPALVAERADYGICIHEGRFTYQESGLSCVEDLGTRWEEETSSALPLGGIVCRRDLGSQLIGRVQSAISRSIEAAIEAPEGCLETMRKHGQESSDEVLWKHVELYVNDQTRELGPEGRQALAALTSLAVERGLVGPTARLELA